MSIILNKIKMNQHGAIFSLDTAIAFSITLISLLSFATALANYSSAAISQSEDFFLEQKTIAVADSFVKNYDANNTTLGSCVIDSLKKRVKSNELFENTFTNFKPIELEGFFIKEIRINGAQINHKAVLSNKTSTKCISVKRFVLVNDSKATVEVMGCLDNNVSKK